MLDGFEKEQEGQCGWRSLNDVEDKVRGIMRKKCVQNLTSHMVIRSFCSV